MCGIYLYFDLVESINNLENHKKLSARGPDEAKVIQGNYSIKSDMNDRQVEYLLAFYRLAIVGVQHGMQPFFKDQVYLLCNGEIYNHLTLTDTACKSDCEVILDLYLSKGIEHVLSVIDGEFAFVILDLRVGLVHFARDPIGVKPLYYAAKYNGDQLTALELSSELKAMKHATYGNHVIPRLIYTFDLNNGSLSYLKYDLPYLRHVSNNESVYNALETAVVKRITQSERPLGFFLSGGLDSSIVLSIAMKYYNNEYNKQISKMDDSKHDNKQDGNEQDDTHNKCKRPKRTIPEVFTFGFSKDAPDVLSAMAMVNWLERKYGKDCIKWHLVIGDMTDGCKRLSDVIYALETYDTTTIRASTPMYMLSQYISCNTDVKVLLSGEGSDELFGGYLYFNYAPNDFSFKSEINKLLNELYLYDVLRADRSTATFGLELRPPFLDTKLINEVISHPKLRKVAGLTKSLLREVISDHQIKQNYELLPESILYGKKEAFSDAVGLQWKDEIAKYTSKMVNNIEEIKWSSHIEPLTDEMKYYQSVFYKHYGANYDVLLHLWLPNQAWVKTGIEPSARVLNCYSEPIKRT